MPLPSSLSESSWACSSAHMLEEGGYRQRVGAQEGVQLAWGVLARLDDEEACVGRDDG